MIRDMIKETRRRGKTRYYISVSAKDTTTGKWERIGSYDSYQWAESIAMDMVMTIKNGHQIDPAFYIRNRVGKYRFSDFVKVWLKDKEGLTPCSKVNYESGLRNNILPFWGGYDLRKISKYDIMQYRQWLKGKPSSKNRDIQIVNNIFTTANDLFGLAIPTIKRFKDPTRRKESVDENTRRIVLNRVKEPHRTSAYVWAYTGMRRCEVMALTKGDINFTDKTITIRQHFSGYVIISGTKEGAEKEIRYDLLYDLEPLLKVACSGKEDTDRLFPYSPRTFDWAIKKALDGIIDIRPHDFGRSTTISHMLDKGYTVRETQAQSGHSNMKIIDRYQQAVNMKKMKPKLTLIDDAKEE